LFAFLAQPHLPRLDVKIVNFPRTVVAAVEHIGSSDDIYDSTRKLVKWRRNHRVSLDRHRTYCVLHDLRTQAANGYRVDICVSYEKPISANSQDVITKVIVGGRCARVRYLGPREHIPILQPLYTEWLPRSGERLRPDPPFLHFVNMGHDIAAHELITDVYLPIAS